MAVVYFWTPDVAQPAGGIRVTYRLVDACNASGIPAAVMHQRQGFRVRWFDNETPVVASQEVRVANNDVLVLSELDAPMIVPLAPGVTKVILNQAHFWTLTHGPVDYRHPDIAAVMSVSDDGVRYLKYAFPGLKPARLRVAVDSVLFRPSSERRQRVIVYPAQKGLFPRSQVLKMLERRGALAGWEARPLGGLDQAGVAAALGESAILAGFSEFEGFQMLLAEGMASGCAVVGYAAGGGREFLTEDVSWPVEAGEIVDFAWRLEQVMRDWEENRQRVLRRTVRARELVRERYNSQNEHADLMAALTPALQRARVREEPGSHQVFRPATTRGREIKRRLRGAARALLSP